jgi:hypothetical protein
MSTLDSNMPLPADEPDGEDVELELDALALHRRRKLPRLTLALSVALVGACAFIGGAEAQKHLGSSSSSSNSASNASSFASRFRNGATRTGGSTFAGGATIGTVTAIKGSTLYVTDTSGNTVKVTTSAATQVSKTVSGTVKSVLPGNTVVIRGSAAKNGTIAATTISLGGGLGAASFGGGSSSSGSGSGSNGGATGFGFSGSSSKGGG